MKQIYIIFLIIMSLSFSLLEEFDEWNVYNISAEQKPFDPINQIYLKLTSQLSEQELSQLKITSAQYKTVNGSTFKINFSYLHHQIEQRGQAHAYVSFNGQVSVINKIELYQDQESVNEQLWTSYNTINDYLDFYDYPFDPRHIIMVELEKQQTDLSVLFTQFIDIQFQIITEEIFFKIKFYALTYDSELKVGTCIAYVIYQERFAQIVDLQLKAYGEIFNFENSNQGKSWKIESCEISQKFEVNFESPQIKDIAYSHCYQTLKKESIKILNIFRAQYKMLQNIDGFSYKYYFISRDNQERDARSGYCLFFLINLSGWNKQIQLIKIVEDQRISQEQQKEQSNHITFK